MEQVSNEVLAERLKNVTCDVTEIKSDVKTLITTIATLVSIERTQASQAKALDNHEQRIGVIERDMPGLREMRGWVITSVIGLIGVVVAAVLASDHIHLVAR
jgi:hypothetical protein